jgi:hypothetical protein
MGLKAQGASNTALKGTFEAGYNSPVMEFKIQNPATSQAVALYRNFNHRDVDDLCVVMEFRAHLDTIGASGVDCWLGLAQGNVLPISTTDHLTFTKLSTDTNWFISAADGSAQTRFDTGVPPVVGVFQTFRVEYHGLNTPVGVLHGFGVGRFFIDGTFVGEIGDANVPSGTDQFNLSIGAKATATGPTADVEMRVGPIRYAYNEVLDGDVPT